MPAKMTKKTRSYCKAAVPAKTKAGGRTVVSQALVKQGASNTIPKIHVRKGDEVMVVSGSKKQGAGQVGKVLAVYPKLGKVLVEGVNIVTRATRQRGLSGPSGLVKREEPIFASRVMLYSQKSKKPVRSELRAKEEID